MKLLRVFAVDDEELALNRLCRLLEQTGRVEITGRTTDSSRAVEMLGREACDVVITDIEMPGLNGFEMLARLNPQPLVIFTTAYSEHALRAFEVNSIDYLLKPIQEAQLERALNKIDRIRGGVEERPSVDAVLAQLAAMLPAKAAYVARLASKLGDRIELVDVAGVTHFYATDKLVYAATAAKDYVMDLTIAQLEERLDPAEFVRIHRSTIVHLPFVKDIHAWFGDRVMLRLNDAKATELTVSRERVKLLKQRLGVA